MSRTRFWTILIGAEPTSFRASDAGTLVPTLRQLQRKHPEAVLRWYERGQLFESEEAARTAFEQASRERRPKEWRPGGEHRDPRERFKKTRDEKRRLFKLRQRRPTTEGRTAPPGARGGDGDRSTRPAPGPAPTGAKESRFPRERPHDTRPARESWRRGGGGATPNRAGPGGQGARGGPPYGPRPRSPKTGGGPGPNRGPKRGRG